MLILARHYSRHILDRGNSTGPYQKHALNIKVSHKSLKIMSKIIKKVERKDGQEIVDGKRATLSVRREKVQEYLTTTTTVKAKNSTMRTTT